MQAIFEILNLIKFVWINLNGLNYCLAGQMNLQCVHELGVRF